MIVDLQRFLAVERPYWDELDNLLNDLEEHVERSLSLEEVKRFHYLYQRASSDLARLAGFPAEPQARRILEPIVARAYAEIHETRRIPHRFRPLRWFFITFPRTFRRHVNAFTLAVVVTFVGTAFGSLALFMDPDAKETLLPFGHGYISPSERVDYEESQPTSNVEGKEGAFAAFLMTHNIRVSITALALGMTWGVGTIILLFSNGVMLGAIVYDYMAAGETRFLAGWLLPHGVIEIPAILIAAQAAFVLAHALIGRGSSAGIRTRFRAVSDDIVTLIAGVALMLVWAGCVEAFLSQYHEPKLPYGLKIAFGMVESVLLVAFLCLSGRSKTSAQAGTGGPD